VDKSIYYNNQSVADEIIKYSVFNQHAP